MRYFYVQRTTFPFSLFCHGNVWVFCEEVGVKKRVYPSERKRWWHLGRQREVMRCLWVKWQDHLMNWISCRTEVFQWSRDRRSRCTFFLSHQEIHLSPSIRFGSESKEDLWGEFIVFHTKCTVQADSSLSWEKISTIHQRYFIVIEK